MITGPDVSTNPGAVALEGASRVLRASHEYSPRCLCSTKSGVVNDGTHVTFYVCGGAKTFAWSDTTLSLDKRADLVIGQMTLDEKMQMVHGTGWGVLRAGSNAARAD